MGKILDGIKERQEAIQKEIEDKLKNKSSVLTVEDINNYQFQDSDKEIAQMFDSIVAGKSVPGFTLKDFVATPQARILIPRVIIGTMRKSADPLYLASQFFKKIRLKQGQAIMFPSIGVMRAYDVAEGQEINYGVSAA